MRSCPWKRFTSEQIEDILAALNEMGINVVETVASFDGLVAGKRGADCAGSSATLRWLAIYAHGVEQWLSLMTIVAPSHGASG
jgi:hypothetical protein